MGMTSGSFRARCNNLSRSSSGSFGKQVKELAISDFPGKVWTLKLRDPVGLTGLAGPFLLSARSLRRRDTSWRMLQMDVSNEAKMSLGI